MTRHYHPELASDPPFKGVALMRLPPTSDAICKWAPQGHYTSDQLAANSGVLVTLFRFYNLPEHLRELQKVFYL